MLKRILAVILCVCIVTALSACAEKAVISGTRPKNDNKESSTDESFQSSDTTVSEAPPSAAEDSSRSAASISPSSKSASSASSKNSASSKAPAGSSSSASSKPAPSSSTAPSASASSSADPGTSGGVSLKGKDVSGTVGSTVTVAFDLSANSKIAAANFTMRYDTSMLQYVEYENGSATAGMMALGNNSQPGTFKFGFTGTKGMTAGGTLVTIKFKLLKKGASKINVTADTVADQNLSTIAVAVTPATVTAK